MTGKERIIGKTLKNVLLSDNKGAIKFIVDNDEEFIARADGDCCSYSWIESVESPASILGGVITGITDIEMQDPETDGDGYVTVFYGCKIETTKGSITVDYRNESNGYYGGDLKWDGEYFCGGVSNQNGQIDESTKWIVVD